MLGDEVEQIIFFLPLHPLSFLSANRLPHNQKTTVENEIYVFEWTQLWAVCARAINPDVELIVIQLGDGSLKS